MNFTTEPQVKWSGLAQIGNNHQQVVCRAEQKHSLPWKHTQIESKTLIIYCESFLNGFLYQFFVNFEEQII